MTLLYLLNFIISYSFLDMIEFLGISGIFFINSGCCLVAALVFQRYLPETKGKKLGKVNNKNFDHKNCTSKV